MEPLNVKKKHLTWQPSDLISPLDFLKSWNYEAFQATKMPSIPKSALLSSRRNKNKKDSELSTDERVILDQIAKVMSVPEETMKELSDVCGKQTLYNYNEPKPRDILEMTQQTAPADIELESVQCQFKEIIRRKDEKSYKVAQERNMKYNIMDDYMSVLPEEEDVPDEHRVQVPNVIITVQITKCAQSGQQSKRFKEQDTYMCLGNQRLTALRDKIQCYSDCLIAGDYSLLPDIDADRLEASGDLYKSSFFFIEDVFYNDMRLGEMIDYSKPIRDWAETGLPDTNYTTGDMHETTFNDLKVKLGYHYLFMHQGNCEHAVLFTDIRLLSSEDVQDVRHYPYMCISRFRNRSVCHACNKFSARWIVRDCPLIPTDPSFFCKQCLKTLLYDADGRKKANFRAYNLKEFYSREPVQTD